MAFIKIEANNSVVTLTIDKDRVNPISEKVVDELTSIFQDLKNDSECLAIILTGTGSFFSFGLEIPELYHYSKEDFEKFLIKFTNLYNIIFSYPKPVVSAINGHAIAAGCMLAIACDNRLMVTGKARISLNEITFGSSVFAGATEILKFVTGSKNAEKILISGKMYDAEEAYNLGLIDQLIGEPDTDDPIDRLLIEPNKVAKQIGQKDRDAYFSIKKLSRQSVLEKIEKYEMKSIKEFTDIWYSENTRAQTKNIIIRK